MSSRRGSLAQPRPAGGCAGGSMAGYVDRPARGVVGLAGFELFDDFLRPPTGLYIGDLLWGLSPVGTVPIATSVVPVASTEVGITQIATALGAAVREGGYLGFGYASYLGSPTSGAVIAAKLRGVSAASWGCFSGLCENIPGAPIVIAKSAVGFRCETPPGGSNWFFVCRNGAVETTLDLGIAADTTWRTLIARRYWDGSWAAGYVDCSDVQRGPIETIVGVVSTNIPANALAPCPIMVWTNNAGVQKKGEIDFFGLGGATAR
jgi:hypothetical protein